MSKRGYNKKLECFNLCTIFLIKSLHLNTILINIEKFACLKKGVKYFLYHLTCHCMVHVFYTVKLSF